MSDKQAPKDDIAREMAKVDRIFGGPPEHYKVKAGERASAAVEGDDSDSGRWRIVLRDTSNGNEFSAKCTDELADDVLSQMQKLGSYHTTTLL